MSRKPFQKGLACYQAGSYQEALEHFNEAAEKGGQNVYLILDSRAAVYAKLGQRKDALRDAKKTIDVAPDRWQGYARAARVFLDSNKPDAALKMVRLALDRLKEGEVDRRALLVALEAEARRAQEALEKHRQRFADHMGKLPIELFGEIVRILVQEDHTALIALLHVCKHWRRVMENNPHLWDTLVLTRRRPRPKARIWIEKSKGRIRELSVRQSALTTPNWPGDSLQDLKWEHLRVCRLQKWDIISYLHTIGKAHVLANLDRLEIDDSPHAAMSRRRDAGTFFTQDSAELPLRHLSLTYVCIDVQNLASRVKNLKSLQLNATHAIEGNWSQLVAANPLLETLTLQMISSISPDIQFVLNHLTCLELSTGPGAISATWHIPQLQILRLHALHIMCDSFVQRLVDANISHLTELTLQSCPLSDFNPVILFIRNSPNLQILEISNIAGGAASVIESLTAHYSPNSSSQNSTISQDHSQASATTSIVAPLVRLIVAPRLTHVNFSKCPDVQTGPLVRLIKSRLPQSYSPSNSQDIVPSEPNDVARIVSLTINECPLVDATWLPWFRERVPNVSCIYMTKKTKFRA